MEKIIALIKELNKIELTDNEKKILLKIINDQVNSPKIKMGKIKRLLGFLENNDIEPTIEKEEQRLLEIGVLERVNKDNISSIPYNDSKKSTVWKYKISSKGLLYIFNQNFIYSPNFLVIYEKDEVLQEILYQFFYSATIKSATAKFFNIIREYLHSLSNYLFNLSNLRKETPTITNNKLGLEIETELINTSLLLGHKIIILFNEYNLLNQTIESDNEKAIIALYEIENHMKSKLANDIKFQKLLFKINKEFLSNYNEITNLIKK